MKYIKEYNSYNEIDSICKKYGIRNYTINKDGATLYGKRIILFLKKKQISIDVDGNVDLSGRNLENLPLNFNRVTGYFNCSFNQLTSLEGCPKEVGNFYCNSNQLTSLKGCPKSVDGNFYCYNNNLTSMKGCPKEVGKEFTCSYNQLISLEGCPEKVGGDFNCSYNHLTSLEGCPKEVGGDFDCCNNRLTSLKGCPKEVGGDFLCYNNLLPKLIKDNIEYIDGIIKWQDDYSIWRKDGSLDEFRFNDMMIDVKNDY